MGVNMSLCMADRQSYFGEHCEVVRCMDSRQNDFCPKVEEHAWSSRATLDDELDFPVMGKYRLGDQLGKGGLSVVHKAVDIHSFDYVAIKIYKPGPAESELVRRRVEREARILTTLQEPFSKDDLDRDTLSDDTPPSELFVRMFAFSQKHAITAEGLWYPCIVMELASGSLCDFILAQRQTEEFFTKHALRGLAKDVVRIVAAVHAKGFVHLDLKPDNFMFFDSGRRLKLIDVDSCTLIGESLSVMDASISYSPTYCAPEWASFLIDSQKRPIQASPALDIWSVGMTLFQLATLRTLLGSRYADCHGNVHSYFQWLGSMECVPLPDRLKDCDVDLYDLLSECLLVCDPMGRKSLAHCLCQPFLAKDHIVAPPTLLTNKESPKASLLERVIALAS